MAIFGLFTLAKGPYQKYEGDFIQQDKEYVKVFKSTSDPMATELVAAIRLDKGQSVQKISD